MTEYENDRMFADKTIPQIIHILRQNAIYMIEVEVSSEQQDRKCATDLVIRVLGGDVAARIRRSAYKYRDLTIRSYRPNCMETEIHKLRNGFARWYFYGWMTAGDMIGDWLLVDLDKVRSESLLEARKETPNGDGTRFISISRYELVLHGCLVASNPPATAWMPSSEKVEMIPQLRHPEDKQRFLFR